jgi:hypothetical protein
MQGLRRVPATRWWLSLRLGALEKIVSISFVEIRQWHETVAQ